MMENVTHDLNDNKHHLMISSILNVIIFVCCLFCSTMDRRSVGIDDRRVKKRKLPFVHRPHRSLRLKCLMQ